jgi:cytochrome bd-type quinol oxidase subunit 2
MLYVMIVVIPLVVVYTTYTYYVFRGKTREEDSEGYSE